MNRLLAPVFAITAAALGYYAWSQHGEMDRLRQQIATLESERDTARKGQQTAERDVQPLRENVARLTEERDAARSRAKAVAAAPGAGIDGPAVDSQAAPKDEKGLQGMAKAFASEEGKKMMQNQMALMMKKQYADLARTLKLPPQVADQVMALLAERNTKLAGDPMKFFSGEGMDDASLAKMAAEGEATRKSYDEKLKSALGEAGFKELQAYEKTTGERLMISDMLEPQLSTAGVPLQGEQRDQLLKIMVDQREKSPPTEFDPTGRDAARNLRVMTDDAALERLFAQEEDYRRRVMLEAPKALSPDQVNALQTAMQQAAEMQKFGIKMGQEMVKAGRAKAAAQPAK